MKTLKTLAILLLINFFAKSQTKKYYIPIPNSSKYWVFESLDDNKRVGIIVGDTLWLNKNIKELKGVKDGVFELRYLTYKGKIYRYSYLFLDPAYFWSGKKKGIELY